MKISRALAVFGFLAAFTGATPAFAAQAKAPANDDCLTCHGDKSAKRDNGTSIAVSAQKFAASVHGQAGLACADCHADLAKTTDFPHKEKLAPAACASCHDSVGASHPFHPGIDRARKGEGTPETSCASCHGSHEIVSVKSAGFRFAPARQVQSCTACHGAVAALFLSSEHGRALARGVSGAPDCLFCHSKVVTARSGLDRTVLKRTQERLCLACHAKAKGSPAGNAAKAAFVASYETSVHGQALARGVSWAPNCVDCHGSHENRHSFDPASRINKMHVQEVCGRCHGEQMKQFVGSSHGMALARGNKDAPACTDCHGEHSILSPKDPRSRVAAANVSARVCAPCHASLTLTEKWNLPIDRSSTFADSYHGLASRGGGGRTVANCASCHGAHDILPSSNPASRVAVANIAATCGKAGCHPGANARFAAGKIHISTVPKSSPLIYWVATLYILLIVGTIGAMLLHNGLDFYRKSKRQYAIRRGEIAEPHVGHALYVRMTVNERLQHGALMVSFIVLVITGFMLRFPEAWWVVGIRRLSSRAFEMRSLLHRVAAVAMCVSAVWHIGYVILTRRGRQLIRDLWWKKRDLFDAIGVVRYNLGLSSDKPKLDRFSYMEKAEYWALVWGTMVMAVTGFVMWFDNTFIGLLTKLGYDVSRTIHFYEAWLATLAIIVWHLYFVLFNPEMYPMNMSWITGRLSEKEMEEEHPAELERIKADREPEAKKEPPPPPVAPVPEGV